VNYDPVKSFSPVTLIAYVPSFLIVNPKLAVGSFQDLIGYARAHPGKLNYASAGADYLQWQLLKNSAKIDMVNVPYEGGGAAQTAVISGEVEMTLAGGAAPVGLVKTGKVKALVVTGRSRSPLLPDVPTVAEAASLPDFVRGTEDGTWFGALAPAGTPPEIVGKMRDEIATIVKMPEVRDKLAAQAFVPVADTPNEFTKTIESDMTRWAAVQATK
jgi:tripartite-type tricarboxylate transporter receptor subunit TctC